MGVATYKCTVQPNPLKFSKLGLQFNRLASYLFLSDDLPDTPCCIAVQMLIL